MTPSERVDEAMAWAKATAINALEVNKDEQSLVILAAEVLRLRAELENVMSNAQKGYRARAEQAESRADELAEKLRVAGEALDAAYLGCCKGEYNGMGHVEECLVRKALSRIQGEGKI